MRKKLSIILISVACMALAGCFIEQAPLTDQELNIVAQHAADVLLKYNKNYSDFLLTVEQLTPTPTKSVPIFTPMPTATTAPQPSPGGEDPYGPTSSPPQVTEKPTETPTPTEVPDNTEETFKNMGNIIGATDFSVDYDGATTPVAEGSFQVGDGVQVLTPRDDGKLYMLTKFTIKNDSDSPKELNCFSRDLTCVLNVNGKVNMYPCDTIFINDLRFIGVGDTPEIIKPGEAYDTVLIFAVDKDTEILKAALTLTNKDKESVVIKIK